MTDPKPGTPEFHRAVLEALRTLVDLDGGSPPDLGSPWDVVPPAIAWALEQIGPSNVTPFHGGTTLDMPAREILLAAADDETVGHCVIVAMHPGRLPSVASTTSDVAFTLMLLRRGVRDLEDMIDWATVEPDPPEAGKVVPIRS